jgi:aryl-alcohol dehydrogenase-like predicted oxidoreductase
LAFNPPVEPGSNFGKEMENNPLNKLTLGSVQFGTDYGITNNSGAVARDEVYKILSYALRSGITTIDTAPGYGNAEEVLGGFSDIQSFEVISKLSPALKGSKSSEIIKTINGSLSRLNIPKLHKVLLHRFEDVSGNEWPQIERELLKAKELGMVSGIGVSLYNPDELEYILDNKTGIDSIQVPLNVFDQRFFENNLLERARDKNIEVQVRSIFLQGLLLTEVDELKTYFHQYRPFLKNYSDALGHYAVSKFQAAMGIALDNELINQVLFGVCSVNQIKEVVTSLNQNYKKGFDYKIWSSNDSGLIDPLEWIRNQARDS